MGVYVNDRFWSNLSSFDCVFDRANHYKGKDEWSIGYKGSVCIDCDTGYNKAVITDDGGGVFLSVRLPHIQKLDTVIIERSLDTQYGRHIEFCFKYGTRIKIFQNSRVELVQAANKITFEESPYYIEASGDGHKLTKNDEGRATEMYIRNAFGEHCLPLEQLNEEQKAIMIDELIIWKLSKLD